MSVTVDSPKKKRKRTKLAPVVHPPLFSERPGEIRAIACNACGGSNFRPLFEKGSSHGEIFHVVRCDCGLVQVNPQPDIDAVRPYYTEHYFRKRTDRGYDNYFSETLRDEIRRVFTLNLQDLDFFKYEQGLDISSARALDAGCAAGYFVEYLKERGWKSEGIELSREAAAQARSRGLRVTTGDFLTSREMIPESYDLISFWASIEHMHDPARVFERAHELLRSRGRLLISTCRYGLLAKLTGKSWRYMNVPEHLYFFSFSGIRRLARKHGFRVVASVTYGSGLTARKDSTSFYRILKKLADPLVKLLGQGDMMALHFEKMS